MKKFFCRCCGHQVSLNRRHISPGYFAACLWCDEDFFRFELREERGQA